MEGATALGAVFDKVQPPTTFEETVERLGTAIRLGLLPAEGGKEKAFERLDELIANMDAPPDFDAYRRADVRFHIALAEATGTPRLIAEMTEVQGEMTELIALIPHPDLVL